MVLPEAREKVIVPHKPSRERTPEACLNDSVNNQTIQEAAKMFSCTQVPKSLNYNISTKSVKGAFYI